MGRKLKVTDAETGEQLEVDEDQLQQGRIRHDTLADELLERILTKFLTTFQNDKGFFYFQQNKYGTNRIPYIRWSQAWAFHALTEYLCRVDNSESSSQFLCKDVDRC